MLKVGVDGDNNSITLALSTEMKTEICKLKKTCVLQLTVSSLVSTSTLPQIPTPSIVLHHSLLLPGIVGG